MANNEFGSSTADLGHEAASRAADMANRVQDKAADMASRVQDKASELGNKAASAVDSRRTSAASGIESAARGLHNTADKLPGGPAVGEFAHKTADKLGATADYVRDNSMRDMLSDVESYVKSHPTQALLGAAVLGFFAGRAVRRS